MKNNAFTMGFPMDLVVVCNRSGAGNYHFRDLQTMLGRQKIEKLVGISIKHGVLDGYNL